MESTETTSHEAEKLRRRSKAFAFEVVRLVRTLPRTDETRLVGKQLLRSGMSVAANYRAVSRSRSRAEFISKLNVVIEEADETLFWLEALEEMRMAPGAETLALRSECNELVAIFVASQRTARRRAGSPAVPRQLARPDHKSPITNHKS